MAAPLTPRVSPATSTVTASGQQMRAILQTRYGTADALSTGEIDRPQVAAADVLVQVRAAGLDRGTWHLMAGLPYALRLAYGLRPQVANPRLRRRGCGRGGPAEGSSSERAPSVPVAPATADAA